MLAHALTNVNLAARALSEGEDAPDLEGENIAIMKGTTFGQGGFYTQVKQCLNPPEGAGHG